MEGRDEKGRFAKGNPGGPGRKKGGRSMVADAMDAFLARDDVRAIIEEKLEEEFKADPMKFIDKYSLPFWPKEMKIAPDGEGKITFVISGPQETSDK